MLPEYAFDFQETRHSYLARDLDGAGVVAGIAIT
jgi:hypothetical protein